MYVKSLHTVTHILEPVLSFGSPPKLFEDSRILRNCRGSKKSTETGELTTMLYELSWDSEEKKKKERHSNKARNVSSMESASMVELAIEFSKLCGLGSQEFADFSKCTLMASSRYTTHVNPLQSLWLFCYCQTIEGWGRLHLVKRLLAT